MLKKILAIIFIYILNSVNAQCINADFAEHFCDSTMRIDYIFSGNAYSQQIALDKISVMPRWYGKKENLDKLPIEGNGQIVVTDYKTGDTLYCNSFSTLFQEWLTYDEAKTINKAFENVFLIPMPKDTVKVTVCLRNNRHHMVASMTHVVNPNDILIRHKGFGRSVPFETLLQAKDTTKCIHIAYVAEGYTEDEMDTFLHDARIATDALFEHEPFKGKRDLFNVIAVKAVSEESGTSLPSQGIWRKTVLGSHFDTFYSNRYLTTLNLFDLHDILSGTPYEHIIVLVNTSEYGGGGILNSYNLSMTHHPSFRQVVVHEFGHSFAGLADEYAYEQEAIPLYPVDVEPWEKNITTLVDFHNKWEDLILPSTPIPTSIENFDKKNRRKERTKISYPIGVYEGAGYSLKGVYRPAVDCRMRSNTTPNFCQACQKAIDEVIDFYTK